MLYGSEYVANASILIESGGSLTIGPNTSIKFAYDRVIRVKGNGSLTIDGPAELKSLYSVWGGILLDNSNETSISNTIIIGAATGVHVRSSGDLVMLNATLKEVSGNGIYLESSSRPEQVVTLSNLQIDGLGGSGVYAPNFDGSLTLFNSTIANASAYGVFVSSWYSSRIMLRDNKISLINPSYTSIYLSYPLIATIRGNDMTCFTQCLYLYGGAETAVDENIFRGVVDQWSYNAQQVYISWSVWGSSTSFSLQSNTFSNWKTYGDAIYAYLSQSGGSGNIVLENNEFVNISAGSVFHLIFPTSSNPVNIANIFEPNLEASSSSCPSVLCISDWPKSCGAEQCTLIGNIFNFSAPAGQFHMIVSETVDTVSAIDASLSYWGTSDESNITETIFDGRDNVALTTIDYLPFLLTHDPDGERRLVPTIVYVLPCCCIL